MRTYLTACDTDATCTKCNTLFEGLPLSTDEYGAYVEIETIPCADEECTTRLCACCPQFVCFACGLTCCMEHVGREIEPECNCIQFKLTSISSTPRIATPMEGSTYNPCSYAGCAQRRKRQLLALSR
jgi:hypothetical protein